MKRFSGVATSSHRALAGLACALLAPTVQAQPDHPPKAGAPAAAPARTVNVQTVTAQQVLAALNDANRFRCIDTLGTLTRQNARITRTTLLTSLEGHDAKLRLRAGWALSLLPLKTDPPVAQALATHLQTDPDSRLRMCCAIGLMYSKTPQTLAAYQRATQDKSDHVAQLACAELGWRGGAKSKAVLFTTLANPSWRVRLSACEALITLQAADARVVATLEKMAREPEVKKYDAEIAEFDKFDADWSRKHPHDPPFPKGWGKFSTILAQARRIAIHHSG